MNGSNVTESVTLANADIEAIIGERRHDPLCLAHPATTNERCHYCVLIARVREDERTYAKQTITAIMAYDEGKREGYAAALHDAVEAVKALGQLSEYGIWHKDGGYCDGEEIVAAIEALGGER